MNPRIKEILLQADFEEQDGHISIQGVYMFDTYRMKRFAELIVRECIEISQVGSITETKIKEHFGVE